MTDRTCQKWFMKFHSGEFSLDDAPRSGRPVEVESNQIETLTENNQRSTMQEIADILKISKAIKLLVKMKNVSFILQKNHTDLLANPTEANTHQELPANCQEVGESQGTGSSYSPHKKPTC